jgi:hypothetical protein
MAGSKGKTAHASKETSVVLTRHVCDVCGSRIPQNEIVAVKVIKIGDRGRVLANRMELSHAAGPCGKSQARAREAAAAAVAA